MALHCPTSYLDSPELFVEKVCIVCALGPQDRSIWTVLPH